MPPVIIWQSEQAWSLTEDQRMATEIVLEGDSEPIFEVDEDIEPAMDEINAWSYLCQGGHATYCGYVVPVTGLSVFASAAETLAEQYGDEGRVFNFARQVIHLNGSEELRTWTVTGPELQRTMLSLAATAREAARHHRSLILNMDDDELPSRRP
jgi:hypothetical protein